MGILNNLDGTPIKTTAKRRKEAQLAVKQSKRLARIFDEEEKKATRVKKNPNHQESLWYRWRDENDRVLNTRSAERNVRNYGYDVYFYFTDPNGEITDFRLPITPSALNVTFEGNNETVSLINEGEINILKSPKLKEISFDALFPMYDHYPFATTNGERGTHDKFGYYWTYWNDIMVNKTTFRFVVSRRYGNYSYYKYDTDIRVSFESIELKEDADEYGQDILVSFKLKEVKEYGVKVLTTKEEEKTTDTSTTDEKRDEDSSPAPKNGQWKTYTVVRGDDLKIIAKRFYDDDSEKNRQLLYEVNKDVIEEWAKRFKYESSSNGHWIFPGEPLVIPYIYDEVIGVVDDDEISLESLDDDSDGIVDNE